MWDNSDRMSLGGETAMSLCASSVYMARYTGCAVRVRLCQFLNKENCISSLVRSGFIVEMSVLTWEEDL